MSRTHSVSSRSFRRAVGNSEYDCVAGAVADTFGAFGEDAEVPLACGFIGDWETGYILCFQIPQLVSSQTRFGEGGVAVLMSFQLHPNSVSPETATALMPSVVSNNENFFRCGTLKEISLTRRTSFPLFNGARPTGSVSSAETSLLTFRFLTEGSGEVDFRVKIYLPISWRRVEYFGFLAESWVS